MRSFARCVAIGIAYYALSRGAMALSAYTSEVAVVWPAAGLGFAACLLWGRGALTAMFAAELLTACAFNPPLSAVSIALGNILGIFASVATYSRLTRDGRLADTPRNTLIFCCCAAPLLALVSAVSGTLVLRATGVLGDQAARTILWTWFLGDLTGTLLVAPVAAAWPHRSEAPLAPDNREPVWLWLGLIAAGTLIFGHVQSLSLSSYPLAFAFLPMLLWAAFRFPPLETAATMLIASTVAVAGTSMGKGPFAAHGFPESLLLLQTFLVILAATTLVVHAVVNQRKVAMGMQRRTQEVLIYCLASLAEKRDNETGRHLMRTQRYARILAESLRDSPRFRRAMTDDYIDHLYKLAPLHDIGKVGVSDEVLHKPGKLDAEELAQIRKHPDYGRDVLARAVAELGSNDFLRMAEEIVHTHHERWDGKGYPQGLMGEAIPISGRLMALADVYDALTSARVYKPAMPHAEARKIITEGRGSHFDPEVVEAFLRYEQRFLDVALRYADADPDQTGLETSLEPEEALS